jgi:hypothetical protein
MSKAVAGAAEIAAGVAMFAMAPSTLGLSAAAFAALQSSLIIGGVSMEMGAIADALTQNRGMGITTRQPAAYRQVIYGEQRVPGIIVYQSTTGSHLDQWNYVIVIAGHQCDAILNLYLDGRQVYWEGSGVGWQAGPGGLYFGGNADSNTHIGPGGQHYNFGGLVYCEARYGNQQAGDVITGLTANDPNWAPTEDGSPYLGGCTYVYLKIEYDQSMFPSLPEIRFTVHGKDDIYDPRNDTSGSLTVLGRPTTILNGWGDNAHVGAYEEGTDQAYNWGLNDAETLSYTNPDSAVDGSLTTYASCIFQHTHQYAGCVWQFGNLSNSGNLYLNVNSSVPAIDGALRSAGIWYSEDNGNSWTEIYNQSYRAQQWDSVALSNTANIASIQVMAFLDSHDDMDHNVYDIQVATGPQNNTSAKGYTTNWALIVADVLTNTEFGLGDVGSVNTDQLIAAANVCDEQVTLANGNVEARYSCHWHYDCATAPGDVLQTMMPAAMGRISRIGGEWFIFPAYWTGPTSTFGLESVTGKIQWSPFRKTRELYNRVNGTYIAANYPYNVAGDLYDSNGWYNGTIQNNFPFAFQPTNYPQYAMDALHGYGTDILLAQDNGRQLPWEITQNCCLSISQAQRCAKIALMRNRQQATGTIPMTLNAWQQVEPIDVIQMNIPQFNYANKQLEITATRFTVEKNQEGIPECRFQVDVQETDQSVYEWDAATEELSPYDVPSNPTSGAPYTIAPPTGLTLVSNANTAVTNNGTVTPRILASWTAPADARVTQIDVQYSISGANNWIDDGTVSAGTTSTYISGVVTGQSYDVRVESIAANGANSVWTETDNCTVTAPSSQTNSYTNNPSIDLTQPTANTIQMGNVAVTFGTTVNYAARTFSIPTPNVATWYYVTVSDPTQGGETGPTLTATCQTSDSLVGATGNTYIGAINALPIGNTTQILAGGWPAPQTFQVS